MKFIWLTFFVVLSMAASVQGADWDGVPTVDLTDLLDEAEGLPFVLNKEASLSALISNWGYRGGDTSLVGDLDGDGQPEIVKASSSYITLRTISSSGPTLIQKQHNFPPEFKELQEGKAGFALAGPFDLD